MVRKILFLILLMTGAALAQDQTPNFHFNIPPHGTKNYDIPINSNFSTLDNLLKQGMVNSYTADPNPCTALVWYNSTSGLYKLCVNGFPSVINTSGVNFTVSGLAPIFSTSVNSSAINFTLLNAPANSVFGNFTGILGLPSYNQISPCGDNSHALSFIGGTGFGCQALNAGTVTGISSGNVGSLFNVSVANPNTAPAITFTAQNFPANTIFGNFTGSSVPPTNNAMTPCGDSAHALGWVAGTGFTCIAVSGGTVTSFSIGNLSPLFNTSVTNPTTTPSVSFTLSNAVANSLFGNFTGSSAGPIYNSMSPCGDSSHALGWVAGTGFTCQAVGTVPTGVANGSYLASNGVGVSPAYVADSTLNVCRVSGVDCTGATDSTTALNTLFGTLSGKKITFPMYAQIRHDHQLTIFGQSGWDLSGEGYKSATGGYIGPMIFGCGSTTGAQLYINRSGYGHIHGLSFALHGSVGGPCATSFFTKNVTTDNNGGGGVTGHDIQFNDNYFTTSPQGGAITNYVALTITDTSGNGEGIGFYNNFIHCQNSLNSFGVDIEGAGHTDWLKIIDNKIASCFQGVRHATGNARIENNLFSSDGNFTVFGANGASIYIGGCVSGPLIIQGNQADSGGPFINSGNDTQNVGCEKGLNIINNSIAATDVNTGAYLVNVGTIGAFNNLTGNQFFLSGSNSAQYLIGSSAWAPFGPQGFLYDNLNSVRAPTASNSLGIANLSLPFQGGEYHSSALGSGGGWIPVVGSSYDWGVNNSSVTYETLSKVLRPQLAQVGQSQQSPFFAFDSYLGTNQTFDSWAWQSSVGTGVSQLILGHTRGAATTLWNVMEGQTSGITMAPIATPGQPGISIIGTGGATTYTYSVVAYGPNGNTLPSPVRTITNGNATLDGTNFNQVQYFNPAGSVRTCIRREAGGATQGVIGCSSAVGQQGLGYFTQLSGGTIAFDDKGLVGDGSAAPTVNTTGQLALNGLGKGNPLTTDGTYVKNSQIYVDASQFVGANGADPTDDCATVRQALLFATLGQRVNASALTGDRKCKSNPYPSTGQDIVEWGPSHWWMQGNFSVIVPSRLYTIGRGRDANPPTGLGATTFTACTGITSNCLSTFTNNIMWCWGSGGVCGVGGGTAIADAPITNITLDCAGAANVIALQDMVSGGRSGAHNVKFENCLNQNSRGLQIAGTNYPSTSPVTVTLGSNLVAGTGFTSDMLNNQLQFSSQAGTNYHVTAQTPTQLTLDVNYTGTTSAVATITVSNNVTQNSDFSDLFFSSGSGSTCDHTGIPLLTNTGSDTNFGPLAIQRIMITNSCTTTTEPDYSIRFSGTKTRFTDIHVEGFNIAGTVFGLDAPTAEVSLVNVDCGAVNTTTGSTTNLLLISNAFTARDIKTTNLKCVAPNPVNLLQDQINSNTVPWSSEASMAEYAIGLSSNIVQTTSGTVTSKLYGMQVLSNYGFSSTTTCSSGTNIFQAVANTLSTCINGVETVRWGSAGSKLFSTYALQWTNGTPGGGTVDLTVQRGNPQTLNIGSTSANGQGFIVASAVRVLSNATFGTGGNVITTTVLAAIPGLSWTIPAVAQAYDLNCKLAYTQATAAAANQFGVQFNTTAPQHGLGFGHTQITVGPPSTYTDGTSSSLAVTTPVSLVTFTPGATATVYQSELHVTFLASGSGTATVNILAATGNIADLLTINADSSCRIEVTNN